MLGCGSAEFASWLDYTILEVDLSNRGLVADDPVLAQIDK
jgi:hypothetical protein